MGSNNSCYRKKNNVLNKASSGMCKLEKSQLPTHCRKLFSVICHFVFVSAFPQMCSVSFISIIVHICILCFSDVDNMEDISERYSE